MIRKKTLRRFFKPAASDETEPVRNVAPAERLYIIGDIHGRNDLLTAMLTRIDDDIRTFSDTRETRLVFLGDYIDRGDHSAEVLDSLSALKNTKPHRFDFLAGNHEAAMLGFLENPLTGADWFDWGGRQTLASYGLAPVSREPGEDELITLRNELQAKAERHLPFLNGLKRYVVSGDVICAHASLDPNLPLEAQSDSALLWGRTPQGQGASLPGYRLVHGHFAAYEPVVLADRICVDTGAYYSGRLTAVRLDDAETFLHVDMRDLM